MASVDIQVTAKRYPIEGGFTSASEMADALEELHSLDESIGGVITLDPAAGGWQLRIMRNGAVQEAAIGDVVVFLGRVIEAMSLQDFQSRYGGDA